MGKENTELKKIKKELLIEKERLNKHLLVIKEGVAIFSYNKNRISSNKNFVRYLSLISKEPINHETDIFRLKPLSEINEFIDKNIKSEIKISKDEVLEYEINIKKNSKYFNIKCIVFYDKSFELLISDLTKREKNRVIKSQITSNIAHELKTPVSAIQAYLETILLNKNIDEDKKSYFIEKAFMQVERLSLLINDISTINKLENAEDFYKIEKVNIFDIIKDIKEETSIRRKENKIQFNNQLPKKLIIKGNKGLLYSIFQNLVENSINYAGNNVEINIKKHFEDNEFYYFSFSDTGNGIPEKHLGRIFERFYRVDSGRSRKDGGTGLGLSITKNAIQFHQGDISAKKLKNGGIEFLFTIKKY